MYKYLILFSFCLLQYCAEKEILPQQVLGYSMVRKISGTEAQKIVNRIHLRPITDTENEIGFYEKNTEQVIIYVTYYTSENDAREDLIKMVEKISPKNSVFINGGQIIFDDIVTYRYFGMGQTHYVFKVKNMLFWLSVDTMIASKFLESYIKYLN